MTLREMVERRVKLWEESKALHDRCKDGVMGAEDQEQWDRLQAEIDALGRAIDREIRLADLERALSQPINEPIKPQPAPREGERPAELRAFDAYLRTGRVPAELRGALQEGDAAEGASLVPVAYGNQILVGLQEAEIFYAAGARRMPLPSLTQEWPTLTNSTKAVLTAEEGNFDEVEPSLSKVTVKAFKYTRLAKVSDELLEDSRVDVWGQVLAPDFAQAFAKARNEAFTVGVGTTAPKGVMVGGTVAVTAASQTAITPDEVLDTYYALDYRHRGASSCRWMAADSTFKAIRKFQDGNGNYIWQPSLQAGQPDRLLGIPCIPNEHIDAIAANKKVMVIGDFSYYWIFERTDIQIRRLNELYAGSGQVGFRAYMRFDGQPMLATAFQILATHA